jgi:sulfide:quinone oxidoreductase
MTEGPPAGPLEKQVVLVLGAGIGGLVAASRLRRMLDEEHRVVLVDRSPFHTFLPSLSWVMLGKRSTGKITRDLRVLAKKGIEFRAAEVRLIDTANKRVQLNDEAFAYDHLVIALGVDYSAEEVPGLNRAYTYYHADGADGLREQLPKVESGRIAVSAPSVPFRCPPSLYEGAFLLDAYFRGRGLRDAVEIDLYTPEAMPLPEAGEPVGQRVRNLLQERNIGFRGGVELKSVNHEKGVLNFRDGSHADFSMLVASPVHRLPEVLRGTGLVGEDGWIAVDPDQLHTAAEDVHAVGDCVGIAIATGSLPKSGVFAHGQAEVVARNIAAIIAGKDPIWAFGGQGACFMETGNGRGVYIVGNYYADPPEVKFHGPSRFRHWTKVGFERLWLWRWF